MPNNLAVARRLRSAAYCASGSPPALVMTAVLLRELAEQLDPDGGRDRDPTIDAGARPLDDEDEERGKGIISGFEAIGRHLPWGFRYYFIDRRSTDTETWLMVYQLGYIEPRYKLPAVRPRIRAKARSIPDETLALLITVRRHELADKLRRAKQDFLAQIVTDYLKPDPFDVS